MLRLDHIVVVIVRELRAQPVRRLGGAAMAERVRNDDEVFGGIERLILAEQLTRECRRQHAGGALRGAVQYEHRLSRRLADCRVGKADFGHGLAGMKFEVARDPLALLRRRIVGGQCGKGQRDERENGDEPGCSHDDPPH